MCEPLDPNLSLSELVHGHVVSVYEKICGWLIILCV
jgi:hypothetical protein